VKKHLKSDPEASKLLKQLVESKGDKLVDWVSLETEYLTGDNDQKLFDFVKKDFLINKKSFLFKFKNGLVREVLTEYFMGNQESK